MEIYDIFNELFGKKEENKNNNTFKSPSQANNYEFDIDKLLDMASITFESIENQFTNNYIKITENQSITYQDNIFIKKINNSNFEVFPNLFFIFQANDNKVVAYGNLVSNDDTIYNLIINSNNINYSGFQSNNKFRIGLLNIYQDLNNIDTVYTFDLKIDYNNLEKTDKILCIDFGTSNTCAGSYGIRNKDGDDIEIAEFSNNEEKSNIYPTIVYVDDCSNPDNIKYLFGYKAYNEVIKKNYDTEASVFFEIKRFISSCEKEEKIYDENGNTAIIKRGDLIKAYLENVVELSIQYFKVDFEKIHFSAPVKLKELFHSKIEPMFKGRYYISKPSESLDEGMAIIYNDIENVLNKPTIPNEYDFKIMVMDCGGGTSDLASCEVKYIKTEVVKSLNINSKFVHGNSNFGGNNITYRILQLIKIKICSTLNPSINYDLNHLIPFLNTQILQSIEQSNQGDFEDENNEIYGEFNKTYYECENLVPTNFKIDEFNNIKTGDDIKKIKRNFYYLWKVAEEIKVKFFEKQNAVKLNFDISEKSNSDENLDLNPSSHYIFIHGDGNLIQKEINTANIEISIKELERLLIGEIYGLLYEVFQPNEKELLSYDKIKLSGQSCKINLFNDLLKEFIPGKKLRLEQTAQVYESTRFKQECIVGCIAYLRNMEQSKIRVTIKQEQPKLIYNVIVEGQQEDKFLLDFNTNNITPNFFIEETTNLNVIVSNMQKKKERVIKINFSDKENKPVTIYELETYINDYGYITQENLILLKSKIEGGNPKILVPGSDSLKIVFAVPSFEGYGMYIFVLTKKCENDGYTYNMINPMYENFQDEETKTFFDGSR